MTLTRLHLAGAFALALLAGCGDGITAPKCDRCGDVRVLTERGEYKPGTIIGVTIANKTAQPLRYDWCSLAAVGRTDSADPFDTTYRPSRRCGFGAGVDEVRARMITLAPGATERDTVTLQGAALQGQYRINLWLVDENGNVELGNPVVSNTFDVFPGASARITSR